MRLAPPGLLVVVAALAGCPTDVKGPGGGDDTPCTSVSCADPLPIGDVPPEGDDGSEGEGDVAGEGEGDVAVGEGEGDPNVGEGEGDVAIGEGEGEGEGDPTGGVALLVTAGPELVDALPGCECNVQQVPASNVDVVLVGPTGTQCKKPADQSCGIDGGRCSCALPSAQWFVSRQEEPRTNEVWPVDEAVAQATGADGVYTVRASVVDDCLLSPGSAALSANFGCLDLDCQGEFGAPSCFDYTQLGATCANAADVAATAVTDADCMARGPVPVRVHVEVTNSFAREFCTTLSAGASVDAVTLRRTNGIVTVANVASSMDEVGVGSPCP